MQFSAKGRSLSEVYAEYGKCRPSIDSNVPELAAPVSISTLGKC